MTIISAAIVLLLILDPFGNLVTRGPESPARAGLGTCRAGSRS
jgi:hypothetical protein